MQRRCMRSVAQQGATHSRRGTASRSPRTSTSFAFSPAARVRRFIRMSRATTRGALPGTERGHPWNSTSGILAFQRSQT
jgi:hypothetical protein